ncbi:MAG: hypothetical protein H0T89_09780 [Deltaproteobacteria bacterium]|nr:hypothetical protein [Deltaproteobacteria bacterium]MDQ3296497.1 hypothetical protein [Myxococcota bacterium]
MSAVCPACGVAVVPGYVRCPRCQTPLPAVGRRGSSSAVHAGGTAVASPSWPIFALIGGGAILLVAVVAIAMRGGPKAAPNTPPREGDQPAAIAADPGSAVEPTSPEGAPTPPNANRINPEAVGRDVERALRRQRLWATVEVAGDRVNIRSGSCSDPGMVPMLDAAAAALRSAGILKARCIEQSGAVVFERDL